MSTYECKYLKLELVQCKGLSKIVWHESYDIINIIADNQSFNEIKVDAPRHIIVDFRPDTKYHF